jgi:hypothetical protein
MPTAPNEFKAEGEAREPTGAWVWLVEAGVSPSQSLLMTDNNEAVTFDSKTYEPFGVTIGSISLENQGTIGELELTVSNAALDFSDLLDNTEGFRDQPVTVTLVHTNHLGAPAARIRQTFYIEAATPRGNSARFQLGLGRIYRALTPHDRTSSHRCEWQYKSTQCGYTEQTGNITGATNASPIVVTVENHGFKDGAVVLNASVGGNTAANGRWTISVIDVDTFSLTGSTGNGAYTSGGTATVSLPTCDRSFFGPNGCLAHDNKLNFGGQPNIPRIR